MEYRKFEERVNSLSKGLLSGEHAWGVVGSKKTPV